MLRANFAHAGGLRIDHVMGLQRLWVIPDGSPPADGAYLYYPVDDLLRLLTLESHRHQAIVLGEDLGTVPDGLREKLIARSILGMRVLLFEQDNAHFKPILDWPDNALATTSTHDLPTLNGWWHGRDIDWNARLGLTDAIGEIDWRHHREREREGLRRVLSQDPQNFREESHETDQVLDAAMRFLGHTRAPLVLLPHGRCPGHRTASQPARHHRHPPQLVAAACPATAKRCWMMPTRPDVSNCSPARDYRRPSVTNESTLCSRCGPPCGCSFIKASPSTRRCRWCRTSPVWASAMFTPRRCSRARAGSMHGYDVVDPTTVNPELGGEAALRRLVAALREHEHGADPRHRVQPHGRRRQR